MGYDVTAITQDSENHCHKYEFLIDEYADSKYSRNPL